jgi:CheY-like chemotaxis protein
MDKRKVMIVDDDKEFLEELEENLTLSGYDAVAINDPIVALESAPQIKPQVILLDLKMPEMNGFQLAEELKRMEGLKDAPIIAMSAHYGQDCFRFLNMVGIRRYLKKPFFPLDAIVQIEGALLESRSARKGANTYNVCVEGAGKNPANPEIIKANCRQYDCRFRSNCSALY